MFSTVKKAVGAFLGGATAAAVTVVLGWFGVEVSAELAAAFALVLATVGTYLAPKNEPA
jgi:hypothetical protein